ncbi:hypothetical protein DOTSEDRAFT_43971 [Dothistroma septosporum NZE10]|uniref:Uncharacterized protein n=1 Tax=Dothistroma septosporum (strain NZE10 / CBS 128990) TaxID=675120 RepID=N1PTL2_DOTSN|nr:hypothetical protein DOTSEDRAFT_43971 [Dothistroma septosporum NZE10]
MSAPLSQRPLIRNRRFDSIECLGLMGDPRRQEARRWKNEASSVAQAGHSFSPKGSSVTAGDLEHEAKRWLIALREQEVHHRLTMRPVTAPGYAVH